MVHHCGLCKKEVGNWKEHVESEEHQKNLANPQKILEAYMQSQAGALMTMKQIEEEEKERRKLEKKEQ